MTLQLCGVLIILLLVACLLAMAKKNGKQAARLKELKRELERISNAQALANSVANLSDDDADRLLAQIATKQRSMSNSKL